MSNRLFARTIILGLLGAAGMNVGCAKSSGPSSPSPSPSPSTPSAAMTITSISPAVALSGDQVRLDGTGFVFGATLTIDGVLASVAGTNSGLILATVPTHGAGSVDVVVTNPGGQRAILSGGFTFGLVTLTASANRITAGEPLSVSWATLAGRPKFDWIALLRIGASSGTYESGWWDYTNGAPSGTFTLKAPIQPGDYEFRYLPNDGYIDAGRSSPVTVTAAASQ
jgi:hypothetical protein